MSSICLKRSLTSANNSGRLSYIDLFAGAGGWSVGFEAAGFIHKAMYDVDKKACATARHNFDTDVICQNLYMHQEVDFPEVDIVVGSPPCQGFSNEGKKDPNDLRNGLVWSFLDIIDRIQPTAWVFENVPGFQRSYKGKWFKALSARLEETDYHWTSFIIDAADYGVPQHRKRFFILASKMFKPTPPSPTHSKTPNLLQVQSHVSIWDAISDLPPAILGDRIGRFEYTSPPSTDYQALMRRSSDAVYNHTGQNHSKRVLEKIRAVPIGGDMLDFIDSFSENSVHYMGGYRRAPKNRPSWTAYWTRGMTSIHPEQHRFLTPRECARIQSFPDDFHFMGTTIENYTQICNAVPPIVAFNIALHLKQSLHRHCGSSAA